MGLEFEKIAALEDVARELNASGLRWAVTNGLGGYPDSIGRDLDLIIEGPLNVAVGHVIKVLESAGVGCFAKSSGLDLVDCGFPRRLRWLTDFSSGRSFQALAVGFYLGG